MIAYLKCLLFTGHNWEFLHNIHGDEIFTAGFHRSIWRCRNCGAIQLRNYLFRQELLCTGVSAVWCPIHGDCTCKDPDDKNDDDCPLHSSYSDHAEAQDSKS